jgi:hypothetical protein
MLLMAHWITMHSLFSLNWDEWASIVAILTAVVFIIRWALNRAHKQLFGPIDKTLHEVKISIDKQGARMDRSENRLEKGDKLFIRHDEELKDHERRITNLEAHK